MSKPLSEKQVLKKLDIPDFRHLSKEKAMQLVSMIPKMDRDVAMKALEQYPKLLDVSIDTVKQYKEAILKVLDSNDKSMEAQYKALDTLSRALEEELKRDELSTADRMFIIEQLSAIPKMAKGIDADNKRFLLQIQGVMSTVVVGVVGVAAAALGGDFSLKAVDGEKEEQ